MATVDSFSPVAGLFGEDLDFGASPTLFDTDDPDHPHMIAAANKNGIVYALDRDDLQGGVLWSYQISGSGASPDVGESTIVSAPFANGTLYVGGGLRADGAPGAVAALDAATGAEKWLKPLDGFVLAAMTTVGDVLIFGATKPNSFTGTTYVVEQATGNTLFTLAGQVFFGEPTYANGQLFVGDLGGALYALVPGGSTIRPDFVLALSPASQLLAAGSSATFKVSTTSARPVTLSVAGLPAGVTGSFTSPTVTAGQTVSLVLSAPAGAPAGPATSFVVTGAAAVTHTARASVRVATPPAAAITSPAAGAVVSGHVDVGVTGSASPGATLTSVTLLVDGTPVASSQTSPATIPWDATSVTAGEHQLTAVAQDSLLLQGASAAVTVTVDDLVAPAVSLDAGGSAGAVSGTVALHATATPSGAKSISRLDVLVDGAVLQSTAGPEIHASWDTRSVRDGAHTIVATAVDSGGRSGSSTPLTLTTGKSTASLSAGGGKGGGCATAPGSASTAFVSLLAVALWMRAGRRRSR
jgi:archaellum component FlaF (FlaF/FlaG flagellin family)